MLREMADPRAAIVDGNHDDTPVDIIARQDIAAGLKMYYGDLYYGDTWGLDVDCLETSTLADLSRQHANCHREVQGLRSECVARGIDFDDEKIRKTRDFHIRWAETLNRIIAKRLNAKNTEGGE